MSNLNMREAGLSPYTSISKYFFFKVFSYLPSHQKGRRSAGIDLAPYPPHKLLLRIASH